ncbi:molybdopterin molybdotransferase [Cohaesibacter sp. ES.047]|uniref:molybdopterin molybdotransferase MoeA n=1 Tax=Cohaesibacter sp. ES.047 TaxID=1798205 RepID=UPI000BB9B85F|nr:gephyrin-like molybdotransferase Glp [Cohaesibacter sp. ES.047]SNY93680.1 molybdopterin molybdotransferase [Cohaesibacter sp. ES.047]
MALMSVEEALARLLADGPLMASEDVPIDKGLRRVLASDLAANRNQPPFDASAMDGYAVKAENLVQVPMRLQITGEAPAGKSFPDIVHRWEAVRIFTGAPVPKGADTILIQENAERDGAFVTALESVEVGKHIRKAGSDFKAGDVLLTKGTELSPSALALAASMNQSVLSVYKRPKVAVLATGDELVHPGDDPTPDQIIASNSYGVAGLALEAGAEIIDLGIASDDKDAIAAKVEEARSQGVDILVTSGGVSVGDHDHVQDVLKDAGMTLNFWRIAMRPGKPLMAGTLGETQVLGLPGNPVSAMTAALLFLVPLIKKRMGLEGSHLLEPALLGDTLAENGPRQAYLRATLERDSEGRPVATPMTAQDSAMLSGLARAECLIVHPPHAAQSEAGSACQIIRL